MSLVFLPRGLLGFVTVGLPFALTSRMPAYVSSDWFVRFSGVIQGVLVLGIALGIAGKDGRATARKLIRLPGLNWTLLALAFPIGIDTLISAGQYAFDRAQWAAHDFGTLSPPQLGSYFTIPEIWLLLFLFVAAFFEEVIFRGLLQTRFVRRSDDRESLQQSLRFDLARLSHQLRPRRRHSPTCSPTAQPVCTCGPETPTKPRKNNCEGHYSDLSDGSRRRYAKCASQPHPDLLSNQSLTQKMMGPRDLQNMKPQEF